MKILTIIINIPLQLFEPKLFCQFFTIYCNKIHEIIAYCNKIFEVINFLLQQQIYYYIKIFIKIFKVYCNKIFLQHKLIASNLIATLRINYCNDFDVIATIFFVIINIFCCSDYTTLHYPKNIYTSKLDQLLENKMIDQPPSTYAPPTRLKINNKKIKSNLQFL